MTFKAKVENIDTSELGSGGRTLLVQPRHKGNFTTPSYPNSIPDYRAKSYLGFRGVFDGNLGAIPIDIVGQRFEKFTHQNGTVDYIVRTITKFSDRMSYNENFVVLDVHDVEITNQLIQKIYLEMQLPIRFLNYISIPPLDTTDMNIYKHSIVDWQHNAEQYEKGAIPQLSMKEDPTLFKSKMSVLCELATSDVINMINLKYANPATHPHQYALLWEKRETNVLFNCFGVPRTGRNTILNKLYEYPIMDLQRYGIDTITYKTRTPDPKYIASLQFEEPYQSIDEFDLKWPYPQGGSVLDYDYWRGLPSHSVDCPCKACKNKNQHDIISSYCYNDIGQIDNPSMGYVAKLHTSFSSELENQKIKKFIRSNEMNAYQSALDEYRRIHFVD